jgi:hypothetical protein
MIPQYDHPAGTTDVLSSGDAVAGICSSEI